MQVLLKGKRVFEQESPEDHRFLAFPANQIKKYKDLSGCIGIKKGDFSTPDKWIRYSNALNDSTMIPENEFVFSDYEYLIYPGCPVVTKQINDVLSPFIDFTIDEDLTSLLKLDKVPEKAELELSKIFEEDTYEEVRSVEVYKYENGGKNQYIMLDSELAFGDIGYEYTDDFNNRDIVSSFKRQTGNNIEYLYKIQDRSSWYKGNRWYRCYLADFDKDIIVLKEIHDIDDMIPFTLFELISSE